MFPGPAQPVPAGRYTGAMNGPDVDAPLAAAPFDLAIIGDGASATLVAIGALARATPGQRIALVGPGEPGLGIAYATDDPGHRLNVPAGKMSALAERPGDFVGFLLDAGLAADAAADPLAARYVPRSWYGRYLQARLAGAIATTAGRWWRLPQRAVRVAGVPGRRRVLLADGSALDAARVVLAAGNVLRPLPLAGSGMLSGDELVQAWDVPALRRIPAAADVLVVGSGLTMADVVVSLRGQGHRGRIEVVSRHGLAPLVHAPANPWPFDARALLALPLRGRVRALRREVAAATAAGQPWQAVFEAIRPLGVALWTSLSQADQRRFLRHVVRYWDVHRHRIAPEVAAVLEAAAADGQLAIHAGGVRALARGGDGRLQLALGRGGTLAADVLVNATGLQVQVARMDDPLIGGLLADGLAAPGAHGLGLDVAVDGGGVARLRDGAGRVQPDLLLVGSLRMGAEWETIAVPELRVQAAATAGAALAGS